MANCNSCPTKEGCNNQESCTIENNPKNQIKRVIGIMSGKGGVGKSTIAALLAQTLHKKGFKVGILDADITGPSIPRLLKVRDKRAIQSEAGLRPVMTEDGIAVMSLNFFVDQEESPVIWRGPIISGTVKQFWTDVIWGELDYLLIDMPPGTGDVALTVMQSIPVNGMVMVSTPHDMVSMIVAKAVNMAKMMKTPIIGIVENMSYLNCVQCGARNQPFPSEELEVYLHKMDLKVLGELPMTYAVAGMAASDSNQLSTEVEATLVQIVNSIVEFDH